MFGSDHASIRPPSRYIPDRQGNPEGGQDRSPEAGEGRKTGRTNMVEIPGTEEERPCDILLIAAGFLGSQKYVSEAFSVELDSHDNVRTESGHYKTNVEKVFAAGDMHRGPVSGGLGRGRGPRRRPEVDRYLMGYTEAAIRNNKTACRPASSFYYFDAHIIGR